ncbi:class I glutamine amidotransferase-like protein [Globomyces pollinis-pini]|nr:class I glutamine amidotransferase-like protein [Globomyces pollinis-pini]
MIIGSLLFHGWEIQDVQSPFSILAKVASKTGENHQFIEIGENLNTAYESSAHFPIYPTVDYQSCPKLDVLLIPGGLGTMLEFTNQKTIDFIKSQSHNVKYMVSVCTGSSLLATAGLLDHLNATTNKGAFEYQTKFGKLTNWIWNARWVTEGKTITASGVSAGQDMGFHLAQRLWDEALVKSVLNDLNYKPLDSNDDPYSKILSPKMSDEDMARRVNFEKNAKELVPIVAFEGSLPTYNGVPKKGLISVLLLDGFDSLDVAGISETIAGLTKEYQIELLTINENMVVNGGDSNGIFNDFIKVKADRVLNAKNPFPNGVPSFLYIPSVQDTRSFSLPVVSNLFNLLYQQPNRIEYVLTCGTILKNHVTLNYNLSNQDWGNLGWFQAKNLYFAQTGIHGIKASLMILSKMVNQKYVQDISLRMEIDPTLVPSNSTKPQ